MSSHGRYIEYLKVGSKEVVFELRIVNSLVGSTEGTTTSGNKWLLPQHWDEVNKIVIKAATKHIGLQLNRNQSEPCDESVHEVEGEHVKIAFFFTPFKAALPYILSPYQSNVSNPADALDLVTADWLLPSPYPYMLVAAVAPSCTSCGPLHLESNKYAPPAIILESDEDTDYSYISKSDSSEQELRALAESNSDVSISYSNRLISKYVDVGSTSAASSATNLHFRSEFDADCEYLKPSQVSREACMQRPKRQYDKVLKCKCVSCATDYEADSPENLNYSSQYVSLSKVSKYTGTESRMNVYESDLSYTQTMFESPGAPLLLAGSGVPTQEGFEFDKTTKNADHRGTSRSLICEPSLCSAESTAYSVKLGHSRCNEPSRISRRKIVQKSPSIHAMLMRSGSPRELSSPSGSFTSSQLSDTQERTLNVTEDKNVKKGISRRIKKKAVGYTDDAHGRCHDETAVNSRLDKSVFGQNRKFGNSNSGVTSETLDSSDGASDIAGSSGARDYNQKTYSKLNSKKDFQFKSSRLAHKKKDEFSPLEMSFESDHGLDSSYGTTMVEQQSSPPLTTRARSTKQDPTGGMKKQESDKASDSNKNTANRVSRIEKTSLRKEKKLKYTNTARIQNNVGEISSETTDNTVVLLPGVDSSSLSKYCGESSGSKGKRLNTMHAKWSEEDSDFTPGKNKKGRQTLKKTDKESKKQVSLPSRKGRNRQEKLELLGLDKTEQNRINKTRYFKHSHSNKVKSEKTGTETLIFETGTEKEKRKRRKAPNDSSESEVDHTSTGENSRAVRRSLRLRSCMSGKCTQDGGNCTCASVKSVVPEVSSAQKFTMEDLSLDDLEQMFKDNINYLEEINRGIRRSERRDHYLSGGMLNENLFFALALCPYSMTQVTHLSALCRAKFCLSLHDRITHFRYITRVLVPDLCTKLFMDRFSMNEQEALTIIDKSYIHVPRKDDA